MGDKQQGKEYRLVLVEWVDSYICATDWANLDDVRFSLTVCHSAGYLVAETKDAVVVVPHVARGEVLIPEGQGCGDMTIPKVAIKSIVDLVPRTGGKGIRK